MAHLSAVDIVILVLYLAGMIGMGVYFARKGRTSERFMAAGRSLPGWLVGMSILGTFVSSISYLANPGKSYSGTWNPFVFGLSLPIAAYLATRFFVPYYRQGNEISAYSLLEKRFGPWARGYAGVCYLLMQISRIGSVMYLMALPLHALLGWPVWSIILGMCVVVTAYTLLGGIEAVIWTDLVQSIVLIGGALLAAVVLLFAMPGGPGELFATAWEQGKFSLGSYGPSLAESTFWVVLVYGLFINLTNFGIDQTYIQRYVTAKSDAEARRSVWLGALAYIPISALLFFVGTALAVYYGARPEALPAEIAGKPADHIFPFFIVRGLPVGVTGILVAGIFAAGMSTVDSSLNSAATLVLTDFFKRYVRPDADEKTSMRVLSIATVGWAVLGTGVALAMIGVRHALDVWWKLAGVFSGGMLGLFLLGFLSRRAKSPAALAGVAVGVLVTFWMSACELGWIPQESALRSPFHGFLGVGLGTSAIVLVGFVVTAVAEKMRGRTA